MSVFFEDDIVYFLTMTVFLLCKIHKAGVGEDCYCYKNQQKTQFLVRLSLGFINIVEPAKPIQLTNISFYYPCMFPYNKILSLYRDNLKTMELEDSILAIRLYI